MNRERSGVEDQGPWYSEDKAPFRGLTNQANRRPAAEAEPPTRDVGVQRQVRPHTKPDATATPPRWSQLAIRNDQGLMYAYPSPWASASAITPAGTTFT